MFFVFKNIVAAQLKERYLKGSIYTYVGDILVSVNPFHEMPELYSEEVDITLIINKAIIMLTVLSIGVHEVH